MDPQSYHLWDTVQKPELDACPDSTVSPLGVKGIPHPDVLLNMGPDAGGNHRRGSLELYGDADLLHQRGRLKQEE